MADTRKLKNPFYIVLMLVGIVFALTACAFGVMTVKQLDPFADRAGQDAAFIEFVDKYGFRALMIELGALAVCTVAAICTDGYWMRRAAAAETRISDLQPHRHD